jgi:3-methylcrotonyl-CoA carboxylase alpha subunit
MEMNTRLQVEHPVTEAITGLDLVEWQFRVAAGERLPLTQDQVPLNGHAVEARLYAEDPEHGFLPSTGRLVALDFPIADGIRIDTGVAAGAEVRPFYDPMIAKLIAHGATREQALDRLGVALDSTIAAGPRTNLRFLAALARSGEFRSGRFDTDFIDRNLAKLGAVPQPLDRAAAGAGVAWLIAREAKQIAARQEEDTPHSPWDLADAFQLSGVRSVSLPVRVDGESAVAQAAWRAGSGVEVAVDGVDPATDVLAIDAPGAVYIWRAGRQTVVRLRDVEIDVEHLDGDGLVRAPMHGKLLAVLVEPGTVVNKGQRVAVVEAMKMEHSLTAPIAGRVSEVAAVAGSQIAEGAKIMVIEPVGDEGK